MAKGKWMMAGGKLDMDACGCGNMKRKIGFCIGAVSFMSLLAGLDGSLSFAQDARELIQTIAEQQKKIQTLTAGFYQKKETSLAKDPLVSSGTVRFKRPDRVHFIYSEPEQMEMVLEGKTIWIYYPVRSQAEKYSFARNKRVTRYLEPVIGIFQKNFGQLADTYDIVYQGAEPDRLYRFRLQPKEEKIQKFLSRVDVWIDKGSGAILRFKMIEASKDQLWMEFKDLQINPPLKDEDLTIRIPPTVKVLEQTSP